MSVTRPVMKNCVTSPLFISSACAAWPQASLLRGTWSIGRNLKQVLHNCVLRSEGRKKNSRPSCMNIIDRASHSPASCVVSPKMTFSMCKLCICIYIQLTQNTKHLGSQPIHFVWWVEIFKVKSVVKTFLFCYFFCSTTDTAACGLDLHVAVLDEDSKCTVF